MMKPDYGPCEFISTFGAACVGARNFLVAYDVNIVGTKEQASQIALKVKENSIKDVNSFLFLILIVLKFKL